MQYIDYTIDDEGNASHFDTPTWERGFNSLNEAMSQIQSEMLERLEPLDDAEIILGTTDTQFETNLRVVNGEGDNAEVEHEFLFSTIQDAQDTANAIHKQMGWSISKMYEFELMQCEDM